MGGFKNDYEAMEREDSGAKEIGYAKKTGFNEKEVVH